MRRDVAKGQGGVMLCIRDNIPYKELEYYANLDTQTIGIKLNNSIKIITYYNRPAQHLEEAVFTDTASTIYVGDLNCKHMAFGSTKTDVFGVKLNDILTNKNLVALNDGSPTRISPINGNVEVLDYAIASPDLLAKITEFSVGDDLASDHLPLHITINATDTEINKSKIYRHNTCQNNWNNFKNSVKNAVDWEEEILLNTPAEIDLAVNNITNIIVNNYNTHCPLKEYKPKSKLKFTPYFKQLVKQRRQARHKQKKATAQDDKIKFRCEYNKLTKYIRQEKARQENLFWQDKCNKLNNEVNPRKFWASFKSFSNNKLNTDPRVSNYKIKKPDGTITTDETEITELFSEHLAQIHQVPESANYDQNFKEQIHNHIINNKTIYTPQININNEPGDDDQSVAAFTPEELNKALKTRKNKSAPGVDEITYLILKNCPAELFKVLAEIFTRSLHIGYFPQDWKKAKVKMIPKQHKDLKLLPNYRPISLLPAVGKLFEKCISERLSFYLEDHDLLTNNQSGFRKNRSTNDQILRVIQSIINGYNHSKITAGIFLDAEKAFDKCWHQGLLYKLNKLNLPIKLVRLISSFITNRKFCVQYKQHHSRYKDINAGVPQGSCLSPILYLIYVNDIKDELNYSTETRISQFADDIALWTQSKTPAGATRILQTAIQHIENWCNKWRVILNPNKSHFVLFHRITKINKNNITINLFGQDIHSKGSATFLGVVLDEKLYLKEHIQSLLNKGHARLNVIRALTSQTGGIQAKIAIKLYNQYIRCLFEYSPLSLISLSKTHLYKLQIIQNDAIRLAYKFPRYVSIKYLHDTTNTEMLEMRLKQLALKQYTKMLIVNPQIKYLEQKSITLGLNKTHKSPISILHSIM